MKSYNTQEVLYSDRNEYWRNAISRTFVPLESTFSGNERNGVIRSGIWGDLRLSEVSCSAQNVIRGRRGAGNHPDNLMLLSFVTAGRTSVVQAGNHTCLGPGEFSLYDTRFPYELHLHGETRQHVVHLPIGPERQQLGKTERLVARSFGKTHPLLPFLHTLMGNVMAQPEGVAGRHASVIYRQFTDLLTMIISDECQSIKKQSCTREVLLFRTKVMINQNLADAALSASQVAKSLQISSRYLSMLMRDEGTTFGRYVLTQRLAKAALMLHSPLHAEASISQLAWSAGFSDMAYFSRAFKAQFDCSPTEYRHQNTTD